MKVYYRDKFILILDKPSGIPVHETKDPNRINFTDQVKKEFNLDYIRTVNRLDLETSGLVVFGIDEDKNIKIDEMMKNSEKFYICVVEGNTEKKFRIESFIKDGNKKVQTVRSGGKKAITEFTNYHYEKSKNYSILKAKLITGRRHQIRIHLFENGNPILGEKIYTTKMNQKSRCMLHAFQLQFINLSDEKINIQSDIPDEFNDFLKIDNLKSMMEIYV